MIQRLLTKIFGWAIKHKQFSSHEVACLAISVLKNSSLSSEDRSLCTAYLLEGLNALPTRTILNTSEQGTLLLNGEPVDYDKAMKLRESAKLLLDSSARRLVKEQITFAAIDMGVHKAINADQIMFSKAALWYIKQEEDLYALLAGDEVS